MQGTARAFPALVRRAPSSSLATPSALAPLPTALKKAGPYGRIHSNKRGRMAVFIEPRRAEYLY